LPEDLKSGKINSKLEITGKTLPDRVPSFILLSDSKNLEPMKRCYVDESIDISNIPIVILSRKPAKIFAKSSLNFIRTEKRDRFSQTSIEWAIRMAKPIKSDKVKVSVESLLNHVIVSGKYRNCKEIVNDLEELGVEGMEIGVEYDSLVGKVLDEIDDEVIDEFMCHCGVEDVYSIIRAKRILKKLKNNSSRSKPSNSLNLSSCSEKEPIPV